MQWWRRARASRDQTPATAALFAPQVLIISDLHLGEDITVDGPAQLSEYIRSLNRELTDFLAHHREILALQPIAQKKSKRLFRSTAPHSGRPLWHLVINGDMFDFVKVSVAAHPPAAGHGEHSGPLLNTADNVVHKLQQILAIHRPFFRELAGFVRDGHSLTVVEGNHDAEFFFAAVQAALIAELVHLSQHPQVGGATLPLTEVGHQEFRSRIQFCSWFCAKAQNYHIEHGHQYDALCSFEYNLAPDDPKRAGTLATPLSHRPMPYVAEALGDFSTHGIRDWSSWQMLQFLLGLRRGAWKTLGRTYLRLAAELLWRSGQRRRRILSAGATAHRTRLQRLATDSTAVYPLPTLEALDALKALPAEYSLPTMLHVFGFDRLLVAVLGGACATFAWASAGVGTALAPLTLTLAAEVALSRQAVADIAIILRAAAAKISQVTQVRYVVFGHSHAPEFVTLAHEAAAARCYINTGSWVTREILRGEAGTGMTYAELSRRGARLLRWRGRGRSPALLHSDWQADGAPESDTAPHG
jgi:UDP-2,3-diacylglucosamine pyrophosphatase LpxH